VLGEAASDCRQHEPKKEIQNMNSKLLMSFAGLVSFLLPVLPVAAQESPSLRVHVPPEVAALHLQPVGRLPAATHMHIAINLPLRHNDALTKFLQDVYTPGSPNFRHYLTPEQFTARFGPTPQDYQSVIDFAKSNGLTVTRTHPGRAIVGIDGSAADIERVLHVKMYQYHHPTEARLFFAPDVEPTLDLKVPISAISGLNNYHVPHSDLPQPPSIKHAGGVAAGVGSGSNGSLLGSDFRNAYVPGVTLTGTGQTIGLFEANGSGFVGAGGYNPPDVRSYESLTGAPNIPIISVLEPNPPGSPGLDNAEFSLDLDMIIAMAPGINAINVYFYDGSLTDEEIYQEMAFPTLGETRPNQISTSFACDIGAASVSYFEQMAAQGQSFFHYTGDGGAYPFQSGVATGLSWVTLVGGTNLNMNGYGDSYQSETAWVDSGGGYFTGDPIPYYQQTVNMSSNQGSTQYRNAPDVAAVAGFEIEIIDSFQPTSGSRQSGQVVTGVGGTSAATPLWAAFTALVNEQAAAQGKPTVGFLNPALYSIGQSGYYTAAFHDITSGNTENSGSPNAYIATTGYDLCTGWGSPTGQTMINALLNLTGPVFVDFNYTGSPQNGQYATPYSTLTAGVNNVASGGSIFIRTGGASHETLTITKPMTITASDGAAVIGH